MSDQPIATSPLASTQSLDEVLNQLESVAPVSSQSAPTAPTPLQSDVVTPVATDSQPAIVTPVTTVPEKPVAPLTPPPVVTAPAQMVTEDPTLNAKSAPAVATPIQATPPVSVSPAPSVPTPAPASSLRATPPPSKSKGFNRLTIGLVGVLLLTGVASISVYAARLQQNTQGMAFASPTPLAVETVTPPPLVILPTSPTPIATPDLKIYGGTLSGKICNALKEDGTLNFYNTTEKTVFTKAISKDDKTYSVNISSGNYVVAFIGGSGKSLFSVKKDDSLADILLPAGGTLKNIDICSRSFEPGEVPVPTTYSQQNI